MRHFAEMLSVLYAEGVEFLLVGGYALAAYGSPRATGDIDFWVNPTQENAPKVFRALHVFGAPLKSHGIEPADFEKEDLVYQIGLPPHRIDIVTSITAVSFQKAWERRQKLKFLGHDVDVISHIDFIINKKSIGRPKDLADAATIEEILRFQDSD